MGYLIGSATEPGVPGGATVPEHVFYAENGQLLRVVGGILATSAASRDQLTSLTPWAKKTSVLSIVGQVRIRSCRKANFNVRQMQCRSLLSTISFSSEMESKTEMAAWTLPKPSAVKYIRPKSHNNIQSPNLHRLLR
ncbi:single-stranded DNA-binding protein [Striga asiatica]|uniref:Single-stranded DNA-binding protein n=1 Tax=Striga asiatica TaxID=4170 RepID=A0A5A7QBW8_STRAF|nr:single-stranded DNA-binding protein [Striga asiatica]